MTQFQKVHHIQQSFRATMDAMARPGTLRAIPDRQALPCAPGKMTRSFYLDTLVTMLIDHAVSFCVLGEDAADMTKAIREETHAQAVPAAQAAFVIVPNADDETAIAQAFDEATGGTLLAPEQGATVIVACTRLTDRRHAAAEEGLYWVSVEGPGVLTSHVFGVSDASWVWERRKREDEYPCGIDILLVDEDGRLAALPRTSFISLLATEKEEPGTGSSPRLKDDASRGDKSEPNGGLPWAM